MNVLYLTDTHLGIRQHFRGAPANWSRAQDHLEAFQHALSTEVAPSGAPIDAVIHSGDVFDRSNPPPEAIRAAVEAFTAVARRVPVFLIPGNHDGLGLARHFAGIPGLTVSDGAFSTRIGGALVGFMPHHRSAEDWGRAASKLVKQSGACDVIVAHQAFDGAAVRGHQFRVGAEPDTVGARHIPSCVRTVLSGHIHPRQTRILGGATVIYPGSTERTAFSERSETKGYAVLEFGGQVQANFIDLVSRPMTEVYVERDLERVGPGHLVRLARNARTVEAEAAAIERGGYVVPWKEESKQITLFE
jgi:DNA repair exonuclease SbcCD nuclease subunit